MDSPRLKLGRAKKHLNAFRQSMKRFTQGDPYHLVVHSISYADVPHYSFRIQLNKPTPTTWPLIAADACQNIISSLDHLFWILCLNKEDSFNRRDVFFPVAKDELGFQRQRERLASYVDSSVWTAIESVQPHKAGNDALWFVHELNRVDKHQSINPMAALAPVRSLQLATHPPQAFQFDVRRIVPLENGAEVLRIRRDQFSEEVEMQVKTNFSLVPIFDRQHRVDETLSIAIGLADQVIKALL